MKKKRILRITTIASQQNLLLRGQHSFFNENGFEVIAMSSYDFHVDDLVAREKCKWMEVPLTRKFNPLKDIWALIVLIFHIYKLKPEIVHTHSPKAGLIGQIASYICKVPCRIHTVAGLPLIESQGLKKQILINIEKLTYYFAHWILPNSKKLALYLNKNRLVNPAKLEIRANGSTNGVNTKYYSAFNEIIIESEKIKNKLEIPLDGKIILFVGRLSSNKGVSELVYAFEKLCATHKKLYLVLVGNFDERDILPRSTISLIENNKRIKSVGHRKDVRPFFYMADLFLFPSYREGLPQSLLQACSMAKCCIATNIDGCNEIIINNINGVLISPKDVISIIDSIEMLLTNKLLSKKYGNEAQKYVQKNFDQVVLWEALKKFYLSKS